MEKKDDLYLINIEECVKENFYNNNKSYENLTNVIHPGSFTHKSYAYCIISKLNQIQSKLYKLRRHIVFLIPALLQRYSVRLWLILNLTQ